MLLEVNAPANQPRNTLRARLTIGIVHRSAVYLFAAAVHPLGSEAPPTRSTHKQFERASSSMIDVVGGARNRVLGE